MSRADTENDILERLSERDMSVDTLAYDLALSSKWVHTVLAAMPDRCHCIAAPLHTGTYRIGAAPVGFVGIERPSMARTDDRIVHEIRHAGRTIQDIGYAMDASPNHIYKRLRHLQSTGRVERIAQGGKFTTLYRATDWTPAPVVERVVLPAWAACLA